LDDDANNNEIEAKLLGSSYNRANTANTILNTCKSTTTFIFITEQAMDTEVVNNYYDDLLQKSPGEMLRMASSHVEDIVLKGDSEEAVSILSKRKPSTMVHSLYNHMKPTPFEHLIAKKGSDATLNKPSISHNFKMPPPKNNVAINPPKTASLPGRSNATPSSR
jgi:hypothetical protein